VTRVQILALAGNAVFKEVGNKVVFRRNHENA